MYIIYTVVSFNDTSGGNTCILYIALPLNDSHDGKYDNTVHVNTVTLII